MLKIARSMHAGTVGHCTVVHWRTRFLLIASGPMLFSACGGGGDSAGVAPPPACTISGVAVSGTPLTMAIGQTATFTASVTANSACTGAVTWTASPSTGTLTPSGNTATFTATAANVYTTTATSRDDNTQHGSATETVVAVASCGTPNGTVVQHTANISASETWAGDGVTHMVPNSINITGAAVVTVQPCAIVAMGQNATINVGGSATLLAAGTSATQQVFFMRADVSHPWGILRGTSATSLIDLRYTLVQGGGSFDGLFHNPAIAVVGPGYFVPPAAVLRVDHVVIDSPMGTGIYIDSNGEFTNDSQQLTIQKAGDYAMMMTMMSVGSVPSGTYAKTGNVIDEILIIGPSNNVFADMTINNVGLPLRIVGDMHVGPSGNNTNVVTLTIKPGVVLKFPKSSPTTPGGRVIFGGNGNSPNNATGVLNAIGTASQPIVFTSGEAVPAPGDWVGLWLDTANGSRLDYVEIGFAGAFSGIVAGNCKPNGVGALGDVAGLIVGDFQAQYVPPANLITNSLIHDSAGFGIDAVWPNASFASPDLTATNTFTHNAGCKQTYNSVTPPGVCPIPPGCTAN